MVLAGLSGDLVDFSQIERRCRSVVRSTAEDLHPVGFVELDHRVRPLVDVVLGGLLEVFQLPVIDRAMRWQIFQASRDKACGFICSALIKSGCEQFTA